MLTEQQLGVGKFLSCLGCWEQEAASASDDLLLLRSYALDFQAAVALRALDQCELPFVEGGIPSPKPSPKRSKKSGRRLIPMLWSLHARARRPRATASPST